MCRVSDSDSDTEAAGDANDAINSLFLRAIACFSRRGTAELNRYTDLLKQRYLRWAVLAYATDPKRWRAAVAHIRGHPPTPLALFELSIHAELSWMRALSARPHAAAAAVQRTESVRCLLQLLEAVVTEYGRTNAGVCVCVFFYRNEK